MKSLQYTRVVIYLGIALFSVSILLSFVGLLSFQVLKFFHIVAFLIALWYLIWHFKITSGHTAPYDRFAEGTILLMIIYNPFKPFVLEVAVWMFLDFIFLWVFLLYISEMKGIEKNFKEGVENWSNIGEKL